ncbi:Ig-like domain-containing protein [Methanobrevibacter sp. TMH8]|uniref:right-handed parallel beta-helix repeat-containing protein n=1 Tax=Methanobrevibacter sp. TMH8 TaxID=2848611 RepID=UPI001CCEE089|nr:right-handed parallel beta-helix repeat-containing protein [Methanobrevibacter sp. TMH8]MBZ9570944.1 Ig-like domain-containing protein [Methanobrevibacter sp. TMH8]
MKIKKITLILLAMLLLICSLSTISAANNTISDTSTGGILQGITDTGTGDTLYLNPGTYNKTNQDTNIAINKNITIQGNGPKDTVIIDAQGLSRIFAISSNRNIIFINITFFNGKSTFGAAISASNSNNTLLTFINCSFINNSASSSYGGGIYCEYANLTIINSTFINNTAKVGSAIHSYGTHDSSIINSTFINNYIPLGSSGGGTINIMAANNFTISDSVFINNSGDSWGGSITAINTNNLTINNCNFINNSATYGGAIDLDRTNNTLINNCEFFDNNASYGGGIYAENGNNLTIISSNFTNNSGNNGAAIYNHVNSNSTTIENNTIVDNNGTGILNRGYNTTISGNNITNNNGNGITNTGNANIENNIIYGNIDNGVNNGGNATIRDNDITNNGNALNNTGYLGGSNNTNRHQTSLLMTTIILSNKVTITVTATDNKGNPIINRIINFYVNGELVGTATTNSNGIAQFTYTATQSGTYNILATIDNFTIETNPILTEIYSESNISENILIKINDEREIPTPTPNPTPTPKKPKNPDSPNPKNDPNKTSNKPVATAAMKETGIPINLILLVLLSCLGIIIRKKQ